MPLHFFVCPPKFCFENFLRSPAPSDVRSLRHTKNDFRVFGKATQLIDSRGLRQNAAAFLANLVSYCEKLLKAAILPVFTLILCEPPSSPSKDGKRQR